MELEKLSASKNFQPGVEDYIKFVETLKLQCSTLEDVSGVSKLERKINAEKKFLNWLKTQNDISQESHLKSSNLSHFSSLVHAAEHLPGVVQVLQPFVTPALTDSLVVDIVAAGGHAWVKVIARKAQALHLVWAGQGQFGERDLVSQAEEYLHCAAHHPHDFRVPQVHFAFYNQVTQPMASYLKKIGVFVWGTVVPVDESVQAKLESCDDDEQSGSDTEEFNHEEWNSTVVGEEFKRDLFSDESNTELHSEHSSIETSNFLSLSVQPTSYSSQICESVDTIHSSHESDRLAKISLETDNLVGKCDFSLKPANEVSPASGFDSLFLHLVNSPPVYDLTSSVLTVHQSTTCITRVNLDITTLIALVSSVTNGNCHFVFRDKVLTIQAKEERESPVLPVLEDYLKDKEIFVCQTAVSSFQSILGILGGQAEKRRAEELLARVRVVKDQPSHRLLALDCQGRVKERSKVIFGTGDSLQAVTMTSNMGFVRAAKSQGVVLSVFLHPARALTEKKEPHARPLLPEGHCQDSLGTQTAAVRTDSVD